MRNFTFGFIIGGAVCSAIFVPLLLSERVSKFEYGRNHGQIDWKQEAAEVLRKEFGEHNGELPYTVLFSVKATSVISVETNGIRTVRVIP